MVIRIFTFKWKVMWIAAFLSILTLELVPFNSRFVTPTFFHSYELIKAIVFFVLGWLTPMAFKTSNPLTRALLVSFGCSALVELLQFLSFGHRFSVLELLVKLVIISAGFVSGLSAVHDRKIVFLTLKF